MKLWQKGTDVHKRIEEFTVGKDRELDLMLASCDVLGSLAHAAMLEKIGLLSSGELKDIQQESKAIYQEIEAGRFIIEDGVEDVHSQVELILTQKLPSRLYNRTVRMISGIRLHDFNCGLKAYKSRVIKSIEVYGEMHRYIPVLAKWAGFKKIGEKSG